MIITVKINTAEAEDGYEEDELPSYEEHLDNIEELLRSGRYNVYAAYVL